MAFTATSVAIADFSVEPHPATTVCRGYKEILDLIGTTEGTDRGRGYNETLSYGAFTNGPVNLVALSLIEIDSLQTEMLKHPKNSLNSSAVGRYQIVRKTLRALRKQLGLTGHELFDASMQDKLAKALLDGRGYQKWVDGLISDRQFQANLSFEWASLTNPATGRGSYKGQNAQIKLSVQQAALDRARCDLADQRISTAFPF
ncbi:hypothetical protein [Rhizobium lusitanum]|uniref:hypothetical protein n=1 Tax=Rhizobium lusitanum TaxID=293958 RepID=UPI0019573A18|nr:hypothetical protein [Rhizobium lusitanum]